MKFLTVIIPVYNESKRLHRIKKVHNYLKKQSYTSQILVVNDGSVDNTLELLKILKKELNFKLLSYTQNKGRGFAVKTAMAAAKSKHKLFLDVDLSTPISEFRKFLPYLSTHTVLIGSRKMSGAKYLAKQSTARVYMGKFFTLLSRAVLGMNLTDFNCGFKCFSNQASKDIFAKTTLNRWGLDCEALFIAKKLSIPIKEIPVNWTNDPNSTVRFPRDIIYSFKELLAVRVNDFKKRY